MKDNLISFSEVLMTSIGKEMTSIGKALGTSALRWVMCVMALVWCRVGVAAAQGPLRFHCERDTTRIIEILDKAKGLSGPEATMAIINEFIGCPYSDEELEGVEEALVVNVDAVNDRSLLDNVVAMKRTLVSPNPDWRDFTRNLENVRYRKGERSDFASRLHYMADWISDNTYKGNVKELTDGLASSRSTQKSLDRITHEADRYPALKDSATLDRMKMVEMGLRSMRVPYMPKETINRLGKELRDGDIIVLLTKDRDIDASHVGFIVMEGGKPFMIHASPEAGKVIKEPKMIDDYFRHGGKQIPGYRIIRIED